MVTRNPGEPATGEGNPESGAPETVDESALPDGTVESESDGTAAPTRNRRWFPGRQARGSRRPWSLSTRILAGLAVLAVVIAGTLWSAPRLAAVLPSGLAPIAAFLTPAGNQAEARLAALEAMIESRLNAVDETLAALEASTAEFMTGDDASTMLSGYDDFTEFRLGGIRQFVSAAMDGTVGTATETAISDSLADQAHRTESRLSELQADVDALDASLRATLDAVSRLSVASTGAETAETAADLDERSGSPGPTLAAIARIEDNRAAIGTVRAELTELEGRLRELSVRIAGLSDDQNALMEEVEGLASELAAVDGSVAGTAATDAGDSTRGGSGTVSGAANEPAPELEMIRSALEAGSGFEVALESLAGRTDLEVPSALSGIADDGTAPLRELRIRFPDAAHRAIRASVRTESGDGWLDRLVGAARSLIVTRSLSPVEGDSADAVLSRMEAHLTTGDLRQVLDTSRDLSDAARVQMEPWLDDARRLQAARSALAEISAAAGTAGSGPPAPVN
ncbi:MAG: hypothetical protein OXI81_20960 [Paracoccaceae bacterium]|nr:hypothetical protein [Paracoccaceae bacterium]